jgi:hypothetical protein
MPSHVFTSTYTRSNEQLTKNVTITKDGEQNATIALASSSTNVAVTLTLDVSAMGSLYLLASAAMTVKTNSTGSPDNTLTLAADTPLCWYAGCGIANPLTTDVTVLYVTCADGGTLEIRALQDITP